MSDSRNLTRKIQLTKDEDPGEPMPWSWDDAPFSMDSKQMARQTPFPPRNPVPVSGDRMSACRQKGVSLLTDSATFDP